MICSNRYFFYYFLKYITMYLVMNINGNCVYYDHYDAKNNFVLLFHES